jgi:hypothetical protein
MIAETGRSCTDHYGMWCMRVQNAENSHLKLKTCSEHAYAALPTVGPGACRLLTSAPAVGFTKSCRAGMGGRALPWKVPGPGHYGCGAKERYDRGIKCVVLPWHCFLCTC